MRRVPKLCGLAYVAVLAAGLIGCGGQESLPSPALRLPGRWQGQMIVYFSIRYKLNDTRFSPAGHRPALN